MCDQCGFHFGGAEPVTRHVNHVVDPAVVDDLVNNRQNKAVTA